MQKKTIATIIAASFILLLIGFQTSVVLAQGGTPTTGGGTPAAPGNQTGGNLTFPNPLGNVTDYRDVVANIVKVVLGIVGVLALIIFIYGGVVWMTSLGNSERVDQGRRTLIWASIGLIVVFASFAIVNLILSAFDATSGTASSGS